MLEAPTPRSLPNPSTDWALFLDVDGTLLDIAQRPEDVRVPPELPGLLAGLREILGGALAFVSGRRVAEIDEFFGANAFAAAGEHGAEIRLHPDRPSVVYPPHRPSAALREAIGILGRGGDGIVVEEKRFGIAVHYRAFPAMREHARATVAAILQESGEPMELMAGKMVWELRSRGSHKGLAIERLMEAPAFRGRKPVFIGDDRTDVDGFVEVMRRGGIALPVGRVPAMPEMAFADPASVRAWLAALPTLLRPETAG